VAPVIVALTEAALAADPLVDVRAHVPDALLDVRYAADDNALGRAVYPRAAAYLRRSCAERLSRAAAELRGRGLRLVVYDAYRPLSVQRLLWAARPDPRFVADPARGSAHNRGGAVDVGLADAAGTPLAMPSRFDEFGPRAAHGAAGVPADAAERARALRRAMESAGFAALDEEWWHYRDPESSAWPLLDVPIEELR
jgi:D-alanyl-D-alanine dipeptidase